MIFPVSPLGAPRSDENGFDLPMLTRLTRSASLRGLWLGGLFLLLPGRRPMVRQGDGWMEETFPRALPRDVPDYHERQAAHFRALASTATTRRVKSDRRSPKD